MSAMMADPGAGLALGGTSNPGTDRTPVRAPDIAIDRMLEQPQHSNRQDINQGPKLRVKFRAVDKFCVLIRVAHWQ